MPLETDFFDITQPQNGLVNGAFRRFANKLKNDVWAALCDLPPPPAPDPNWKLMGDLVGDSSIDTVMYWAAGAPVDPHNIKDLRITLLASTVDPTKVKGLIIHPAMAFPASWNTASGPAPAGTDFSLVAAFASVGDFREYDNVHAAFSSYTLGSIGLGFDHIIGSGQVRFEYHEYAPEPEPVTADPLPTLPVGYPPSQNVTVCNSFDDVCANLNELSKMIRALVERDNGTPPAKPALVRAGLTHADLTGSSVIATELLAGARVVVRTVPQWVGRNETSVTEYGSLGTVSFETAFGWTRPVRLRHEDNVLFDVPAGVTHVNVDLAVGVVADLVELILG